MMMMLAHLTVAFIGIVVSSVGTAALQCSYTTMPKVQHATLTAFFPNRKVVFSCSKNYVVQSTSESKQTIPCTATGWGKAKPCVPDVPKCKTPQKWKRMFPMFKDEHRAGAEVKISCPTNLRLVDDFADGNITCTREGWNVQEEDLDFICERDTCKVPGHWKRSASNKFRREYWRGQKVAILCPGNKVSNEIRAKGGVVTCGRMGKWNVEAERLCNVTGRRCRISSDLKAVFPKRRLKDYYLSGEKLIFSRCPSVFPMTAAIRAKKGIMTCSDGKWDVTKPCKVSLCKYTNDLRLMFGINDRSVIGARPGETKVVRTCLKNQVPTGTLQRNQGRLKCLPGGRWSPPPNRLCFDPNVNTKGSKATCKIPFRWRMVMGPGPDVLPVGQTIDASRCPSKPPEMLRTNGIATCKAPGRWSPNPKQICLACFVRVEWRGLIRNKGGELLLVPPGANGPVQCGRGSTYHPDLLRTQHILACDRNGKWNINPPVLCYPANPKNRALMMGAKCRLPKQWRKILNSDQPFINPGFGFQINCAPGTVLNPSIQPAQGIIKCAAGRWNVDTRGPACIRTGRGQP